MESEKPIDLYKQHCLWLTEQLKESYATETQLRKQLAAKDAKIQLQFSSKDERIRHQLAARDERIKSLQLAFVISVLSNILVIAFLALNFYGVM